VVGGVARELFAECDKMADMSELQRVAAQLGCLLRSEVMKLAIVAMLMKYGVSLLLYTFVEDVVMEDGRIVGVVAVNKSGRTLITSQVFVDCSGDGDVASLAGAPLK